MDNIKYLKRFIKEEGSQIYDNSFKNYKNVLFATNVFSVTSLNIFRGVLNYNRQFVFDVGVFFEDRVVLYGTNLTKGDNHSKQRPYIVVNDYLVLACSKDFNLNELNSNFVSSYLSNKLDKQEREEYKRDKNKYLNNLNREKN